MEGHQEQQSNSHMVLMCHSATRDAPKMLTSSALTWWSDVKILNAAITCQQSPPNPQSQVMRQILHVAKCGKLWMPFSAM